MAGVVDEAGLEAAAFRDVAYVHDDRSDRGIVEQVRRVELHDAHVTVGGRRRRISVDVTSLTGRDGVEHGAHAGLVGRSDAVGGRSEEGRVGKGGGGRGKIWGW